MPLLYSAAVGLYHAGIRIAARWNPKARAWVTGRQSLWERLENKRAELRGCLWMHCASVGEFEQGRPVLERIKAERPELPVLLTFFSPSGYEARKDYPLATHVDYLPPDSVRNGQRLVDLLAPRAAVFVKYEFWYHHLHALKAKGVPTFLVSAIFREGQPFFKWYGGAWRSMLACYTRIFTQDEASKSLLAGIGITNVSVSGDTRFDRVLAIAAANEALPLADEFKHNDPVLLCGSTWPQDEELLLEAIKDPLVQWKVMVAPHELRDRNTMKLLYDLDRSRGVAEFWSQMTPGRWQPTTTRSVVVDRMGLLARLYKYADIAYVGGGFGDGIHSLLEAAAWGKPVIFGPHRHKFPEAQGLIDAGGGFEVRSAADMQAVLRELADPAALEVASRAAERYVRERAGASERVAQALLASV